MELAIPFPCGIPHSFSHLAAEMAAHKRGEHWIIVFNKLQNCAESITELELLPFLVTQVSQCCGKTRMWSAAVRERSSPAPAGELSDESDEN